MPELDANIRNSSFEEVALGYTPDHAIAEAKRCFGCKNAPCVNGCPVGVQIPEFISHIQKEDFKRACSVIRETNSLPAICGRVCPQERQCESLCVRRIKDEPIAIGRLERFAADYSGDIKKPEQNGIKIAVIGAGPAGLSCAGELAKQGFAVTIFEALHIAGGVLCYGIPNFRLPKDIVRDEIETLMRLGVEIKENVVIGKTLTIDDLFLRDGFKSVFIGSGAGVPNFMGIEGENLNGVYSANEFLTRVNLMKAYEFPKYDTPITIGNNVAIVGGGNVAMDAARCAKRLGAKNVYIMYRREEKDMPARLEEVRHAKEEGIEIKELMTPIKFMGSDKGLLTSAICIEMELGEPDASGRCRPVEKLDSQYEIPLDTAIIAIGQTPNPLVARSVPNLKTQSWGGIIVDEKTGLTNIPNVYAGGDAVLGAATVILAMGAGKTAAEAITAKF